MGYAIVFPSHMDYSLKFPVEIKQGDAFPFIFALG